jgi:hypothetical protein
LEQRHDGYAFSATSNFFERDFGREVEIHKLKRFEAALIQIRVEREALRALSKRGMDGKGDSFTTRPHKWY